MVYTKCQKVRSCLEQYRLNRLQALILLPFPTQIKLQPFKAYIIKKYLAKKKIINAIDFDSKHQPWPFDVLRQC
jgi:hypothetical protein